jgi:cold shock CspA family protein
MQTGTISTWNAEKGFGFITPESGGKDLFAHIKDYSREHKPPVKGLEVAYSISADPKGRRCAVEVRPVRGHKNNGRELRQKTIAIVLLSGFTIVLFSLLLSGQIPVEIAGVYVVMSAIAFAMYAKDKNAAE